MEKGLNSNINRH
jgi:hypothetical protein